MEFGVHLPVLGLGELPVPVNQMLDYVVHIEQLGFPTIAAHDHLVNDHAWLDGPTMLAAAAARTTRVQLITAVWLPVLRGPVALARAFIALDLLSGGRIIAGLGAGSSLGDYTAAGVPFAERWVRFDESVLALRALWRPQEPPFRGRFYDTDGVVLRPGPTEPSGLPIWIGAWGSDAGLRRVARLGTGWIASAYNTTPTAFANAWQRLQTLLPAAGQDPQRFGNAIATMALHITDDRAAGERMLTEVLGPLLHRSPDDLATRLLVGTADQCAATLRAYQEAGAQQIYLMPVRDAFHQLDRFCSQVLPLIRDSPPQ